MLFLLKQLSWSFWERNPRLLLSRLKGLVKDQDYLVIYSLHKWNLSFINEPGQLVLAVLKFQAQSPHLYEEHLEILLLQKVLNQSFAKLTILVLRHVRVYWWKVSCCRVSRYRQAYFKNGGQWIFQFLTSIFLTELKRCNYSIHFSIILALLNRDKTPK